MHLAYYYGEIIQSCLSHPKNSQINTMFKTIWWLHIVTFPFGKYFLHQNDANTTLIGNYGKMNTNSASGLNSLEFSFSFPVKMQN